MTTGALEEIITGMVGSAIEARLQPLRDELERLTERVDELSQRLQQDRWPMLLSPRDAAAYLGISKTKLNALVDQELIAPTVPYGMEQRYYTREALDAWRLRGRDDT